MPMSTTATGSLTIENAANQLAETIKACPEWNEFHRLNETFEKDEDVSRMLNEYRQIVAQVQGAHSRGEETPNEMRQLEQLQIKIQQNPVFQQREQAAEAMLSLLGQANAALTLNLGVDFAANAKSQQEGCCGGGEGEGGGCGCNS